VGDEHRAAREWIGAYAERLGVSAPTDEEFDALLELAAIAAHASERVAAPVACWMAGVAGLDPAAVDIRWRFPFRLCVSRIKPA